MENPEQYCEEKAKKSGSSFYYSFLFLPKDQKKAILALYAFCREVDDIVDDCTDPTLATQKLKDWTLEVDRIFKHTPKTPIGHVLASVKDPFALPKTLFDEIIEGMAMDLQHQPYKTFDDLKVYCERVASAPGLLAARIFGYKDPNTLEYAQNLGIAFQCVNIIRDVFEDAKRGRLYIPLNDLEQFKITPADIVNKHHTPAFQNLMRYQAERAKRYYKQALAALPPIDQYRQRSGIMMANIYFTLLHKIEKSEFNVFEKRIALPSWQKVWIALQTYWQIKKIE